VNPTILLSIDGVAFSRSGSDDGRGAGRRGREGGGGDQYRGFQQVSTIRGLGSAPPNSLSIGCMFLFPISSPGKLGLLPAWVRVSMPTNAKGLFS
jgi:hypothetical protein